MDHAADSQLNEDTRLEGLLELLAEAAVGEIRSRYLVGAHIHSIRYARSSGSALVDASSILRMDITVLRRHARVAEMIRRSEFESLVMLRTPRGLPLTWSHFEQLATVRSAKRRRILAEMVASEDLSVRALAARTETSMDGEQQSLVRRA